MSALLLCTAGRPPATGRPSANSTHKSPRQMHDLAVYFASTGTQTDFSLLHRTATAAVGRSLCTDRHPRQRPRQRPRRHLRLLPPSSRRPTRPRSRRVRPPQTQPHSRLASPSLPPSVRHRNLRQPRRRHRPPRRRSIRCLNQRPPRLRPPQPRPRPREKRRQRQVKELPRPQPCRPAVPRHPQMARATTTVALLSRLSVVPLGSCCALR
mmetsp:Transcript_15437/g.48208  ORF Transcript_15437/g.48208 Transcript_15437/m.48208 type:complete len:210 (-) Transcript_15437:362-991(-)